MPRLSRCAPMAAALLAPALAGCAGLPLAVGGQPDAVLQQRVESVVDGFHGDIGVYIRRLTTGQTAAVNADSLFPTASMVKVPILCGLFDRIAQGDYAYDQELVYRDSLRYDDGVTGSLRDSTRLPLAEAVMLMITLSDNTASLWLQELAGTGTSINGWLETNGFHQTRVNSRTPGREAARVAFGWGQTTPREMAELLTLIHAGRAVDPGASEQMLRVLSKPYWDGEAVSQIPPTVHAASKSGAVAASKSEVVLVDAPSGAYVFCVATRNQQDQRWEDDNEGYVVIRRLARTLWEYFEPGSTWTPRTDDRRWVK
jgi:beta-lactamase class A